MRKILVVAAAASCCWARPPCASHRARKTARQGKRCRIRDRCEASPAPPATHPVSGCRTKEANLVSLAPPAMPRVNKTQQVDKEPAAAGLTQGLRRHAEVWLRQAQTGRRRRRDPVRARRRAAQTALALSGRSRPVGFHRSRYGDADRLNLSSTGANCFYTTSDHIRSVTRMLWNSLGRLNWT